jgi:RNA polymerase sigma-70 factor (ECF subfamily)
MNQMPEELRTVLTLFYVEDLSYKDIAGVMQCPVGTVMSRLFMARQTLKQKMARLAKKDFNL